MFYRLLSVSRILLLQFLGTPTYISQWKNPRATAISFIATLFFIFAARYLNLIRYMFKATWMTLGGMWSPNSRAYLVLTVDSNGRRRSCGSSGPGQGNYLSVPAEAVLHHSEGFA